MAQENNWNEKIIEEFRVNEGKVGGPFEGAPLLLLHSTGAGTGQVRVNPLMYRVDGERMVVFGSKGGAPSSPDWYYNLIAHPRAKVEVGTKTVEVTARVAKGEERQRLWSRQKQDYPGFADYERRTTRQIPVVVLEGAGPPVRRG